MNSPIRFIQRMAVFVVVTMIIGFFLVNQLLEAFFTNVMLNGLILFVLVIGIIIIFRRVFILKPEISWIESYKRSRTKGLSSTLKNEKLILLASISSMLEEHKGRPAMSSIAMRSLLDSLNLTLYESREISRYMIGLLFFLGLLGFCHAVFATYWMLIGNPPHLLIQKFPYLHSSTGLFINRSVFGTFLLLCAFSGLYYMVVFFQKNKTTSFGLFEQINTKIIFVRIFIIFLTIGMLTTWSRIVNFSYVLVLISFLIYSKISFKKYINPLSTIILFILVFDILVLGLVFGLSLIHI